MTKEQNEAIVKAQVDAHFGPKPPPPPKKEVLEKVIDYFVHMARKPAPKPVDLDYVRQIRKAHRAGLQKESSSNSSQQAAVKKCGKTVPQLGEQAAQSTPHLLWQQHMRVRTLYIIVGKPLTFPGWAIW